MTFLALIIALSIRQLWSSGEALQSDDWFGRLCSQLANWNIGDPGRVALAILVPVTLSHWLLSALDDFLFGLLWIVVAVLLLLYSFGRGNFQQWMDRYRRQCRNADFEGAYLTIPVSTGAPESAQPPESAREVHDLVQRHVVFEGYQRWFAVLFYFVLLGPVGALAYRLLQLCREQFETDTAARWLFIADWVPARLLAASFSLTGDFVHSREPLMASLFELRLDIGDLLHRVASAAIATPAADFPQASFEDQAVSDSEQLGSLLSRSAACWVAVISLLVLLG